MSYEGVGDVAISSDILHWITGSVINGMRKVSTKSRLRMDGTKRGDDVEGREGELSGIE